MTPGLRGYGVFDHQSNRALRVIDFDDGPSYSPAGNPLFMLLKKTAGSGFWERAIAHLIGLC
jgi:hypothetical protein